MECFSNLESSPQTTSALTSLAQPRTRAHQEYQMARFPEQPSLGCGKHTPVIWPSLQTCFRCGPQFPRLPSAWLLGVVDLVGKPMHIRARQHFSHTLIRSQDSMFTTCGPSNSSVHRCLRIIRSFHRHRLLLLYLYRYKYLFS